MAVPAAFSAWILGIPVVTHEQTTVPGLANRIVGFLSKKIAITFPGTYGTNKKVVLTGNPTRKGFFNRLKRKSRKIPTIFVTGGSRGSSIINENISEILNKLLKKYRVFHQTGILESQKVQKVKDSLSQSSKDRYHIAPNYTPEKFEERLLNSDLVISRAGANTVLEIAATGTPAILIPIPWSGGGEQVKNAKILEESGIAKVLNQDSLTSQKLLKAIEEMLKAPPSKDQKLKAKKLTVPKAAENLARLVLETANE